MGGFKITRKLTPDFLIDKIENIKIKFLKKHNYKGLLIDLDNTLTWYNHRKFTKEVEAWLDDVVKAGIKVVIISNNDEKRIKETIGKYNFPYVYRAKKPFKRGYKKALELLKLEKHEVLSIGDQIFTDTFGSKRAGLKILLVDPLPGKEFWFTYVSRFVERRVKDVLIKNSKKLR